MPALWECESCGYTESFSVLKKTVVKWVYSNDIWATYRIFALEEDTIEAECISEDECRSWEDIIFTCPMCGYKETMDNIDNSRRMYPYDNYSLIFLRKHAPLPKDKSTNKMLRL